MFSARHRSRSSRPRPVGARPRRGIALIFILVFVTAMASLAMASIFMSSNSNLLAKSYDRERDLRYAAEAALSMGKARVNSDPAILVMDVGVLYKQLLTEAPITGADGKALPGIKVNLYVGQTGSSSGQYGRFGSIVAQAFDSRGNGYIRRLELTQESFAKFAYWSNSESNSGSTIFFNSGDQLWGPVWSNDTIHVGTLGATFHDQIGTAKVISGKSYGTYIRAPLENQRPILLPSTAMLGTLSGYATIGGTNLDVKAAASNDETKVLDRLEFIAFDIDKMDDSTSDGEGFFRWYQGNTGTEKGVRGDWIGSTSSVPATSTVERCGDWHYQPTPTATGPGVLKFYPAAVHDDPWFKAQIDSGMAQRPTLLTGTGFSTSSAYAAAEAGLSLQAILRHPNARCYLAGDPHLVATDRVAGQPRQAPATGNYTNFDVNKGGEDTTFTPNGKYGTWKPVTQTTANDTITKLRPWDGRYLYSLSRRYNTNMKGVIYTDGNVGISGVVNGLVTLYSKGNIVLLDDIRYANDPVKSVCHDILGLISDFDIMIADNAINSPVPTTSSSPYGYTNLDDTKDMFLHSVIMALNTSFGAENYNTGPTDANDCDSVNNGRGCIYLSGGIIQTSRGAVGTTGGTGFSKRYTYDHCAIVKPPPYFPTTGRFQDNRYLELDPIGFDPKVYYPTLAPLSP